MDRAERSVFGNISSAQTEERTTTRTVIVGILIIVIIIIITAAIAYLILIPASTTTGSDTSSNIPCTASIDCSAGQLCAGGICRSIQCILPPAPLGLILTTPNTGIIVVTWTAVASALSYRIYMGTNPNFSKFNALDYTISATTSVQFTGILAGFVYYIYVTSVSECGEGPQSLESNVFMTFVWPNRFVLNSPDESGNEIYDRAIAGDINEFTTDMHLDYGCRAVECPCIGLCEYQYDDSMLEIQRFGDDTICMVSDSADSDVIKMELCASFSGAEKQWVFVDGQNHICLASNINKCMALDYSGGGLFGTQLKPLDLGSVFSQYHRWKPISVFGL